MEVNEKSHVQYLPRNSLLRVDTLTHTHTYPLVCLNTVISLSLYPHRTPKLPHSPPKIMKHKIHKKHKTVAELQNVTFSFVSLTGHPCEPAYVLSVSPAPVHCKTRTADTWGAITVSNSHLHRIYIYTYNQQSYRGAQCCYGKIDVQNVSFFPVWQKLVKIGNKMLWRGDFADKMGRCGGHFQDARGGRKTINQIYAA